MRPELDQRLCERYPQVFADRQLPTTQSLMGWGFMCGDGWFELIDTLCKDLQQRTDRDGAPQILAQQVKEKDGVLHFYVGARDDIQAEMIATAAKQSQLICEACGRPGELIRSSPPRTRCGRCQDFRPQ